MRSTISTLALILAGCAGTVDAQGITAQQRVMSEPTVAEITRVIGERERGNWREPIDYFRRFTPTVSTVNDGNVAVWDAYLQLRVETWFERSQQWKTRESIDADAKQAINSALDYFAWYRGLPPNLTEKLPRTPADSPYAKITAPGRIRFGVAIFGNALLQLGRSQDVLAEFSALSDNWFGDEAFRVWIAAAGSGYSDVSGEALERLQINLQNGSLRREEIEAFAKKFNNFLKAWDATNAGTPLPDRWQKVKEKLPQIVSASRPIPTPSLSPTPASRRNR
jgi:hypothetical protein